MIIESGLLFGPPCIPPW